jgi:hypothetical protein
MLESDIRTPTPGRGGGSSATTTPTPSSASCAAGADRGRRGRPAAHRAAREPASSSARWADLRAAAFRHRAAGRALHPGRDAAALDAQADGLGRLGARNSTWWHCARSVRKYVAPEITEVRPQHADRVRFADPPLQEPATRCSTKATVRRPVPDPQGLGHGLAHARRARGGAVLCVGRQLCRRDGAGATPPRSATVRAVVPPRPSCCWPTRSPR